MALATPESPSDVADDAPGAVHCEKCAAPLPHEAMAACPACGWYARLRTYVEVTPEYEDAMAGRAAAPKSHLEVWSTLVPAWGWAMLGLTLVGIAGSFAVRYSIEDPDQRGHWALLQMLIGAGVFGLAHFIAFFIVAAGDPDMGVFDMVVKPFRAWGRLLSGMPHNAWVPTVANLGLTASVCAVAVIGGINWDAFWEWNFRAPVKKNLLAAVAAAGGPATDMSMEEALGQFAQDAAIDPSKLGPKSKRDARPAKVERKKIDAIVLGFVPGKDRKVESLLLATEHNGALTYAGRVTPKLPPEEDAELATRLWQARASHPLITVPAEAEWVRPKFACRISYEKRVESGMLQSILWEEMLGELQLPW